MNGLKLLAFCFTIITSLNCSSQKTIKIKVNITLRPIEHYRHRLNNCKVICYLNKIPYDSTILKKNHFKKTISTKGLYKFEFKKDGYVSKHVLISSQNLPEKKRNKHVLEADINLFPSSKGENVDFLKTEPISIGYYNETKKEMMWDFEYNRSVVEKIIHAQTKE